MNKKYAEYLYLSRLTKTAEAKRHSRRRNDNNSSNSRIEELMLRNARRVQLR